MTSFDQLMDPLTIAINDVQSKYGWRKRGGERKNAEPSVSADIVLSVWTCRFDNLMVWLSV